MTVRNDSDTFDLDGETTVHRLGYGAMRLTGENIMGPPADEAEACRILHQVLALGVDFIDTADSYGPGVSERLIGEALAPYPEDLVVATKGGTLRNSEAEWVLHGDPDYLQNAVRASLDRLRTDQIDLYQYHRPDPDTPFEDTVRALADLKDQGLVKHVGLSNVSVEQLERAREIVDVATVQNRYHIAHRDDEDVLEACEEYGVGFMPWNPIGGRGGLGEKAAVLDDVADAHDASRRQIALAWLLEHSPVILPIPGTSSIAHLRDNVAASGIDLTAEEYDRLSE